MRVIIDHQLTASKSRQSSSRPHNQHENTTREIGSSARADDRSEEENKEIETTLPYDDATTRWRRDDVLLAKPTLTAILFGFYEENSTKYRMKTDQKKILVGKRTVA